MTGFYSNCLRCTRGLKDPKSRTIGLGPVCVRKVAEALGEDADDQELGGPGFWEAGLVCKRHAGFKVTINIPQVVVWHSPTGMEWGYNGSGPADLALNVMHIMLPPRGHEDAKEFHGVRVSDEAVRLHQHFKADIISRLPREGGTVPIDVIQAWVRQARGVLL